MKKEEVKSKAVEMMLNASLGEYLLYLQGIAVNAA